MIKCKITAQFMVHTPISNIKHTRFLVGHITSWPDHFENGRNT